MRSGRKISTKRPMITPRTGSSVDGPFAESTVCIVYRWAVVPSLTQRNMVVEAGGVETKTRFETPALLNSAAHCSQPCYRSHLCWISLDQCQRIDIHSRIASKKRFTRHRRHELPPPCPAREGQLRPCPPWSRVSG